MDNLCNNVRDFGAKGDGLYDDTASIQAAIDSVSSGYVELFFDRGIYRITRPLRLTGRVKVSLSGIDSNSLSAEELGTRLWTKEISGSLFTTSDSTGLSTISLRLLEIDGSNGRSALGVSEYSTTWTGLLDTPASSKTRNVLIDQCRIMNSAVSLARGINLYNAYFAMIQNTKISGFVNGYGIYQAGAAFGRCINTIVKACAISGNREGFTAFSNVLSADFQDCAFALMPTAICALDANISFLGCSFDLIGTATLGGDTPITTQDMGVNDGVTAAVDAAIHLRRGKASFRDCRFNSLVQGKTAYWFRGNGKSYSSGLGGYVVFDNCRKYPASELFFAPETTPATRLLYCIRVEDPDAYISGGGLTRPVGIVQNYQDAREVSEGRVMVQFTSSESSWMVVRVDNKRFIVEYPVGTTDIDLLPPISAAYYGGSNLVSDRVLNTTPTVGAYLEWVCITAGDPGVWMDLCLIGGPSDYSYFPSGWK